ncbi:MAG: hypothetical protein IIX48_12865 [Lachnospiraceae bacterium]|nr:hypothetical protein [Lachnospiraceae bacterium]
MENSSNTTTLYKIVEDKANSKGLRGGNQLEADIQVAYLNMLHEQGLLTDNIHSIALDKVIKGVI